MIALLDGIEHPLKKFLINDEHSWAMVVATAVWRLDR
jgi:hypothetical protein